MSSFDILRLCLHAVAWTVVDPQLAHAFTYALPVPEESGLQAVEPRHDPRTRGGIPQIREPLSHGRLPVDSLVLTDLHLRIVA